MALVGFLPLAGSGQDLEFHLAPLTVGFLETDIDSESARFEEYRDLGSGLWIPSLRIFGDEDGGDRYLRFDATDVARDHARYRLAYGVWGRYRIDADYNKIQHLFGNEARFLFNRSGPARFEIPDPVQEMIESSDLSDSEIYEPLLASADRINLGLQRNRSRVGLELGMFGSTTWKLDYTHEDRTGSRPLAGSFGFGFLTEIPEPIDYDTTAASIQGEWQGSTSGLQFGYRYSQFENGNDVVIWDNPNRLVDAPNGGALGLFDLAPNNESSSIFVKGRTLIGERWRIQGSGSYSELTQDDPLQPYTINPLIVGIDAHTGTPFDASSRSNLPQDTADQKVAVLNLVFGVDGKIAEDWHVGMDYRHYDYDNQSDRIEFDGYIRFHAGWSGTPRITVPYSYGKDRLGLELAWTPSEAHRFELTYDLEEWDREFRETETTDEDIIGLQWTGRFSSRLTVRAGFETSDRTHGGYEVEAQEASFVEPEGINNQPTLRKFPQANRETDRFWSRAELFFADAWNLSIGVAAVDEDYPESEFGLVSDDVTEVDFEVGYTPGEHLSLFVFGHISDRDSFQRARQSGGQVSIDPLDDWELALDEANDTLGFGLTSVPHEGWKLAVDVRYAKSDGAADFSQPVGSNLSPLEGFDNYEDIELLSVDVRLDFELSEHSTLGLWYLYEDFTIDSFILQGLTNVLPSSLLLAAENGDYQANVLGVGWRVSL
jgi:MtrB/PioB family decaheme-associated outer membrane protein